MSMWKVSRVSGRSLPFLGLAVAWVLAPSQPLVGEEIQANAQVRYVVADEDKESKAAASEVEKKAAEEAMVLSDRWIGVVCEPMEDSLRAHIAVPEGVGMIVTTVVPGAPADRAGLQQYDIIVSMNGEKITSIEEVGKSVKEAGDQGIDIVLFRKGQQVTKNVKPEKRPAEASWTSPDQGQWVAPEVDTEKVKEWVESLRAGKGKEGKLGLRFLGPGMELEDDVEIPNNISIAISRKNDEPAKITIKRGDESWEVTEDRLDELPEDIRPFVKRMVGKGIGPQAFSLTLPDIPGIPHMPGIDDQRWQGMEERMEDMRQKIEQMLQQMEQLQEQPDQAAGEIESEDA